MGVTDLDLKQALEREAALSQAQLASVCEQINGHAAQWQAQLDSLCAQVNQVLSLHRRAIEHLLSRRVAQRGAAPTGSLAELQCEVAALKANAPVAPIVNVTVPERQVTVWIEPQTHLARSRHRRRAGRMGPDHPQHNHERSERRLSASPGCHCGQPRRFPACGGATLLPILRLPSDSDDCKIIVPHIGGEQNGDVMRQGCGDPYDPHKDHRDDDRTTDSLAYLRPLPGSGTRSTTAVSFCRRACSTGMNSPVRASRPRRLVSGGLDGGLLLDIVKSYERTKSRMVERRGDDPRVGDLGSPNGTLARPTPS
jgi:hypothetical protein